jgi:hypothetical protein
MADVVACRCRGNCGLHDGTCGRPVEQPHDAQDMAGGVMGTWYQTGLCEACWSVERKFLSLLAGSHRRNMSLLHLRKLG